MLEIENLSTSYGLIKALKGVSLTAEDGKVTCILGPNGAGKTTLMFTAAGILKPDSGSVKFGGAELAGLAAPKILQQGLALAPENRLVFPQMSVRDNLLAGAYIRHRSEATQVEEDLEKIFERFPVLKERTEQTAGTLSGGEQQMLSVARALMSRPKMLLLDEPSVGLAPLIVDEIFSIIRQMNKDGISILLVEQNAVKALEVADHFYLLDQGKVAFSGTPGEMANDDVIRRAYLGEH
ncbi:MAG: ABC transporter ATP-binding protein [Rhodospirillales bacterium]|nr:ABC transporter ATP-binding protein [Rhodospirillales bacterium]